MCQKCCISICVKLTLQLQYKFVQRGSTVLSSVQGLLTVLTLTLFYLIEIEDFQQFSACSCSRQTNEDTDRAALLA